MISPFAWVVIIFALFAPELLLLPFMAVFAFLGMVWDWITGKEDNHARRQ